MTDNRPPWIEWNGQGPVPIKIGQLVERRYRDGDTNSVIIGKGSYSLREAVWEHDGDDNDIIAYRIIP